MIAIKMTFPAGRWHATPWGRQVNEGAVEWPPAPWRFLRALLAVWHQRCHDVPEDQMRRLITALAPPPSFYLPPALQGHTRHYMPVAGDKRTKVFDTFVTVNPQDAVLTVWPDVDLDDSLRQSLARLLDSMTYFGRAESWVCAGLLDAWEGEPNTAPANGHATEDGRVERVRLLGSVSQEDYVAWRAETLQAHLDRRLREEQRKARDKGKEPSKVKLSKKQRANVEMDLPETLFDALHASTGDLRKAGWNRPPGSRWIDYLRPADAVASKPHRPRRPGHPRKFTIARFAVCGSVRPRLTEALWVGERVRSFAMGCSRKVRPDSNAALIFSGKLTDGSHSAAGHIHAHFLCESAPAEQAGRISHLTVFAPNGFDRGERLALTRLRGVWGHGGRDLQLVLLGIGGPEDFGGTDDRAGQSRLLDESDVWQSRTPFVPTDHLRIRPGERRDPERRGAAVIRELQRVVQREMERRPWLRNHLDLLDSVEPLLGRTQCGTPLGGHFTTWLTFRRTRQHGNGRRGDSRGYGFRLNFARPVRGPIVLGYGCHFGLGQFWVPPNGQ